MKRSSSKILSLALLFGGPLALSQLLVVVPKIGIVLAVLLSISSGLSGGVAALAISALVVATIVGLLEGEQAFIATFF